MHSSCRCQRPRTISHRFPVPPRRLSAGGEGWSSTKQRGSHTCSLPHTSLASGCCSPPRNKRYHPCQLICWSQCRLPSFLKSVERQASSRTEYWLQGSAQRRVPLTLIQSWPAGQGVPPHRNTTGEGVVEGRVVVVERRVVVVEGRVVVVEGGVVVVVEFPWPTEKRGKQHDWAKAAVWKL